MKPAHKLADEMMESAAKRADDIMAQREDILEAFIAKHGLHPDQCQQVIQGNRYFIIRLTREQERLARQRIIERLFYAQGPNRWQRFCLWLARLK